MARPRSPGRKPKTLSRISTPLIEPRPTIEQTRRSKDIRIMVRGIFYHGWLTPSDEELQPGIPASFELVFWNKYVCTIFYGPEGWQATTPGGDESSFIKNRVFVRFNTTSGKDSQKRKLRN